MAYKTTVLGDSLGSTTRADVSIWNGEGWESLIGQEVYDGSNWKKFRVGDEIYDEGTWYTLIVPEPDLPTRYSAESNNDRIFISTTPNKYLDKPRDVVVHQGFPNTQHVGVGPSIYIGVSASSFVGGNTVSSTTSYTRVPLDINDSDGVASLYVSDLTGNDSTNIHYIKVLNQDISFIDLREFTSLATLELINCPYITKLNLYENEALINIDITNARLGSHFTMPRTFTNIDRLNMPDCGMSGTLDISAGTAAASLITIDLENNDLAGLTVDTDTTYGVLKYINLANNCFDYDALYEIFYSGGTDEGFTTSPLTAGVTNGVLDISYNPGTEQFVKSTVWTIVKARFTGRSWTVHENY